MRESHRLRPLQRAKLVAAVPLPAITTPCLGFPLAPQGRALRTDPAAIRPHDLLALGLILMLRIHILVLIGCGDLALVVATRHQPQLSFRLLVTA